MSAETIPHGRFAGQPIEAVPKHHQQWLVAMNAGVADKNTALLERCDRLKRGSECSRPIHFNAEGQRHAEAVARADEVAARSSTPYRS